MLTIIGIGSTALLVIGLLIQRRQTARQVQDLRTLWGDASKATARAEECLAIAKHNMRHFRGRSEELARQVVELQRDVAEADSVAAGLRLELQPDIADSYNQAVKLYGYDVANAEMRRAALGASDGPWQRRGN